MNRTGALVSFTEAWLIAKSLLDLDTSLYRDPPAMTQRKQSGALRGGAVVLLVSAFETYIKDVLKEHFATLDSDLSVDNTHLLEKLRMAHHYSLLRLAATGGKAGISKSQQVRLPIAVQLAGHVHRQVLREEAVEDWITSPSPDSIREAFGYCGVNDLWNRARVMYESSTRTAVANTFVRDKLTEILDVRNTVVHKHLMPARSRQDLRNYFIFLKVLTPILDRILRTEIARLRQRARV